MVEFSGGRSRLNFNFAYVWSREIDDVTGARTVYNIRRERGLGGIDRTNVVTVSADYKLPLGKGHHFGSNSIVSPIVSGFELSSIVLVQSGGPLGFGASCNTPFTGGLCVPNYNPNFVGSPVINGGLGSGMGNAIKGHNAVYLNVNAFANPDSYTFGNTPRSAPFGLRNPYTWNQDLTLRRTFGIWENLKLQAAVSAFNLYNAVNFGGVNTSIASTSFGTVSSQANQPRKLQGEARLTF